MRQAEGLVASLFALLGVALPVPDHTTLSRRGRALELDRREDGGRGIDLAIDSTGLRLARPSGAGREGWRKLHIVVDPATGRVMAEELTASPAVSVACTAMGHTRAGRRAVWAAARLDPLTARGRHARYVAREGRAAWERATGYGRRNIAEATFSRLKRVLGDTLRSRGLEAQRVEVAIATRALNRMAELGMPRAQRAA